MMYLGDKAVGIATSLPVFANVAKVEFGNYTPIEDEDVTTKYFSHSLGEIPDFIIFFATTFTIAYTYDVQYLITGSIIKKNIIGDANDCILNANMNKLNTAGSTTSARGSALLSDYSTNNSFRFFGATGAHLKAGITYNYVIGKFKEVTENANE